MIVDQQWRCVSASVAGSDHLESSLPCQDAHSLIQLKEHLIGIISDGAGSASHAEVSSKHLVKTATSFITDRIDSQRSEYQSLIIESFEYCHQSLEKKAQELNLQLKHLNATLIIFIATKSHIYVGHIGDGAVVAKLEDSLKVVSQPAETEFQNQTDFITSSNWRNKLRLSHCTGNIIDIAAFSDGIQHLVLDFSTKEAYSNFFNPVFAHTKSSKSIELLNNELVLYLNSNKICENTSDDKTLILACKIESILV